MDDRSAGARGGLPMDARRASHIFPPEVIAQIQRTAAEGHYEIRGLGRQADLPRPSTTCCSSPPRSPGTRWRATGRNAT